MLTKILFIINPHSGTKLKPNIEKLAKQYLDADTFYCEFNYTEYKGHASQICKDNITNFDVIVAVGGDGTIHEVAQHIIHTSVKMGIVPLGSGNGLAHFMKIPLSPRKAIQCIANMNFKMIDTILCGSEYFINVAGIGFDAYISDIFNKTPRRGRAKYVRLVGQEIFNYPPQTLTFCIDGIDHEKTFFVAAIANSSQWGMNAHIAPMADIADGFFEVVFVKQFPLYMSPTLIVKLFTKQIHTSKHVEICQARTLTIKSNTPFVIHLDGEPRTYTEPVKFSILQKSLSLITSC